MTDQPESLDYLWDGTEDGWVVITSDLGLGTIYNTETHMALILEDEAEYEHAIRMMHEHGRPFLDSMP
ncbi:F0F1-type ATP synthase gamma subunit [Streptomyces sp. SAI-135]|uniref:hypothetical protein n=1 Tax=unclassified Streptomyces TaxID=2593676 RepID=UPI0024763D8E|nr:MULTISPECIES: hypothetical protein [unclassified Streptomyces]MDH6522586.1 F0F1-type ATP synthase gamma subunit [Streptomyces sp. SAI-090]MDH6554209.1 F0F1-type ATP synthase gamma subunit [Streptomyces sp. SAI-041]MDH6573469.1 F0F1-type ATP synthase gamma subunit [Streptomyces sp. SAI-117]MDH6581793.1 F0F1-type ATP synthase gamma subunit [Streptomyces sp. SAI-133]MDH6613796.1 F0F1-type ATP synthase gamma subunit [Streptomyces sp. SAI-135]